MSEIVKLIQDELAQFNKVKQKLVEKLRIEFPGMFVPIFEKYPELQSFGWTQYVPYFNDGDECVFGVHTSSLYINEVNEEDYEWHNYEPLSDQLEEASNELSKILNSVPDDFYRDLFDEGEITVYRDGSIKHSRYEHD